MLAAGCASLLLLNIPRAAAQACTGYVLYKEDFGGTGSSQDIGQPLDSGITSYEFTTGIVNDGQYSIRKSVPETFQSWLHGPDHSGNGYMMVVNASYDSGLFYETRVDNLCQGSSFYFSAWIANLLKASASDPLDPDLKFVIRRVSDGVVIDSVETGKLPRFNTLTWQQYGIHFDLPVGESSVILQIFNHQTGGSGNDLVLDDITFSLCGPAIQVEEAGLYQNTHDACIGDPISFKAVVQRGFYNTPQYQWQFSHDMVEWQDISSATTPALNIPSAQTTDSGWYRILVAESGNINSEHCRIASEALPLYVWMPRSFTITANSPVCEGSSLTLSVPQALKISWQGPGGFTSAQDMLRFTPAKISQQGIYHATLTTQGGCVSSSQQMVAVQPNDLRISLGRDSILCQGNRIMLNAANMGATYQWNTGEQTPSIEVDTAGYYQVLVSKGICQASDSISIREIHTPQVNLGEDTTLCLGETFQLDATFADAQQYVWQDGSTAPVYQVKLAGTYSVTVSNQCAAITGTVHVQTEVCADHLIFPTAFSPNGDGQNDFFRPRVFLRVDHYEMKIFDRWGHLVFDSEDPDMGWNGSQHGNPVPMGAYVWIVHYLRERDHKLVEQKGAVTLVR